MSRGLHHVSQRKRIHAKHEVYPHPDKFKKNLDRVVLILAGMWPLANLPQALQVHITKEVSGLNLFSWCAYVLFTVPWIIYGFLHKEKLIQFAYTANLILYLSVVIGILLYN